MIEIVTQTPSPLRLLRGALLVLLLLPASAALAAPSRWITIDSLPQGAAVYVDGKDKGLRGNSSSQFRLRLTKGTHTIGLELDGYKPLEQVIAVTQNQKFVFSLDRAPARLAVRGGPAGTAQDAAIFVDGLPRGKVPSTLELRPGRHLIEVRREGFKPFSQSLEGEAGTERSLVVVLEKAARYGSLLIAADVADAQVSVDGVPKGPVPVLVDKLLEGEHKVEVTRADNAAAPWRQTIEVSADKQVRLMARPPAPAPRRGSLVVLAPETGAEVIVDGTTSGRSGQPITDLAPGEHVVDVRAKGRKPVTKTVTVEAGQQRVERVEMEKTPEARGVGTLRVVMANPVDGASYYIDGRKYEESKILASGGVELSAGRHIVVVRKDDYSQARKDLELAAGGDETAIIDLSPVGRLTIQSTPPGAEIFVDRASVGRTPYIADALPVGQHVVELRLPDHDPLIEQVAVRPGEQAQLAVTLTPHPGAARLGNEPAQVSTAGPRDQAPPPGDRRSQSSLSAVTLPPGAFAVDAGSGYPYFLFTRLTVGAVRRGGFGLDAGVELRSTIYETDIGANARFQWLFKGPFAVGTNFYIGGGGGPRGRSSFVFEAGIPLTLVAGRYVHVTLRPYLQIYSDRHCPANLYDLLSRMKTADIKELASPEYAENRCTGGTAVDGTALPNAVADAVGYDPQSGSFGTPSYNTTDGRYLVDGNPVLDRFFGVRALIQGTVEVSILRNLNIWVIIEGAPSQSERQAFTKRFNRIFPTNDLPLYGRGGATFKF